MYGRMTKEANAQESDQQEGIYMALICIYIDEEEKKAQKGPWLRLKEDSKHKCPPSAHVLPTPLLAQGHLNPVPHAMQPPENKMWCRIDSHEGVSYTG